MKYILMGNKLTYKCILHDKHMVSLTALRMLFNTDNKKCTSAIEVRLIDKASGPVVVENGAFAAIKLHSRTSE